MDLLGRVSDPQAHAVGEWNIAETTAHLAHAWSAIPRLARRDLAGALRTLPATDDLGTPSGSLFPTPQALSAWTARAVGADPHRDLTRLAEVIRTQAQALHADAHDADASPRAWAIEGITGTPVLFGCHLLGETLVHGDDIARGAGLPWTIEPRSAALVLRWFMFDVLCQATAADPRPSNRFRIELQLAGQDRFHLVKDSTGMRIEPASGPRTDAHLYAEPASFLRLIWNRRSAPALIVRGKLLAWGPRPWKLRNLMALVPDV